jgi:predicted nuclease of predicted toxin-antitoxin system
MKIKLDENLPLRLASSLKGLGHDVYTAHEEGLGGCADREIWEAAQKESRFLITQDLDFSDARQFVPGSHCGILLVRLHSPKTKSNRARRGAFSEGKRQRVGQVLRRSHRTQNPSAEAEEQTELLKHGPDESNKNHK